MPVIIYSFFSFIFLSISMAVLNSSSPNAISVCLTPLRLGPAPWALPPPSPLPPAIILLQLQTPPLTDKKFYVPRALARGQVLLSSPLPARVACLHRLHPKLPISKLPAARARGRKGMSAGTQPFRPSRLSPGTLSEKENPTSSQELQKRPLRGFCRYDSWSEN